MAYDFSKLTAGIKDTEEWLARELSGVRTGRANPSILDSVKPEVYGSRTPIQQVASMTVEDARTIRIVPWDKTVTKLIEKAVQDADLGLSVSVDDQGLRVSFSELTSERRTQLQKLANEKAEHAKVTLRGYRNDAMKDIDAAEKEGDMGKDEVTRLKEDVQKHIDKANEMLEAMAKKKQDDLAL